MPSTDAAVHPTGFHDVPVRRARTRHGLADAGPLATVTKRTVDVVGAAVLLVLLAPLLALVTVLVVATSPGPAVYVQRRVGRDGAPFALLKFRSMVADADRRKASLADVNEASGPTFKLTHDPRVTRLGRLLRRFSLDELPQLVNVLQGSMSLVGPRPALPEEVAHYDDRARRRLAVKPGLTCLWQVGGRSEIPFEEWVAMDLAYIRGWSLWLDLVILARTLPAVVGGRGAW